MDPSRKKRCIAYVRAAWEPRAWVPCIRRRQWGSVFCRRHEDAVNGAVLGLWVNDFPENARTEREPQQGAHTGAGRERTN
jgi:hypothetical protein